MPELPEVETIKNDLKQKIVGEKIVEVKAFWPQIIKDIEFPAFQKAVRGQKIINVSRRAKNLIIELSQGLFLLIHLKMTGHIIVTHDTDKIDENGRWLKTDNEKLKKDPQNQFIRIIFYLESGKMIAMSDLRKFAYIKLVEENDLNKFLGEYGPEPFDEKFTVDSLKTILRSKNLAIKKVLMDQKNIAGIGNIYADEILWTTKIHPLRKSKSLSDQEIAKIYENTKKILASAIQRRGTSTSDFRDTAGEKGTYGEVLSAYRMTGLPCSRCGKPIKRISLGGRGTHFCDFCQKEEI